MRNQPGRQGCHGDTGVAAVARILGTNNPPADQTRRNKIDLLGHFFADAVRHLSAAGTWRRIGLNRDGFGFQMHRYWMTPTRSGLTRLRFRGLFFGKNLIAIGRGAFGLGFHIVEDVLEFLFLFGGQPVGSRSK